MIKILKVYSRSHRIAVLSEKGQGVAFDPPEADEGLIPRPSGR